MSRTPRCVPAGYEPHAWALPGSVRTFWGPVGTPMDELFAKGEEIEIHPYDGEGGGPPYPHIAMLNVRVLEHRVTQRESEGGQK